MALQITGLEYDPIWARHFERIKTELATALSSAPYLSIEHVGSTSVPGIAAKPIIVIDIVVAPKHYPAAASALSFGGYVFKPEPPGLDRMSFRYKAHALDSGASLPTEDGDIRRAVYLFMPDADSLLNHRTLKSVLLQDAVLAREYSELKLGLATHKHEGIGQYVAAKNAIIQKIFDAGSLEEKTEAM